MKTPLDNQVIAGLMEILRNKNYYYQGTMIDFNRLTDDGKEAIVEFISIMAPHMIKSEENKLNERSKRLMIEELKS